MVDVAQQVRATDCGSVGRGFEPHLPPAIFGKSLPRETLFVFCDICFAVYCFNLVVHE